MSTQKESPLNGHPPKGNRKGESLESMKQIHASSFENDPLVDMSSTSLPSSSVRPSDSSRGSNPATSYFNTGDSSPKPLTSKSLVEYCQYLDRLYDHPTTAVQMRQERTKEMMAAFESLGIDVAGLPDRIINSMTNFDGMGPIERYLAEADQRQYEQWAAQGSPAPGLGDGASSEVVMASPHNGVPNAEGMSN